MFPVLRPVCEHVEQYAPFGEPILHDLTCQSCGRNHSLLLSRYACNVCGAQCQTTELGNIPEEVFKASFLRIQPEPQPTLFRARGLSYGTKEFWQFVDGDYN